MTSQTVETYVKNILLLEVKSPRQPVSTGQIATALSLSPGTVTSMLKRLSDVKLFYYIPYRGARLSPAGRTLATSVLRRHRLLGLFLSRALDMKWDEVDKEAERLGHAVSDRLVDRIEEFLRNPEFDAQGDPIPEGDGTIARWEERTIMDCQRKELTRFVQISRV